MVARVRTVAFQGVEVIEVETQVTIASGLPAFTIVGLPSGYRTRLLPNRENGCGRRWVHSV
jgi:hypothetical protein